MKKIRMLTIVIVLIISLFAVSLVFANGGERMASNAVGSPQIAGPGVNVVQDGSFEDGTPNAFWGEASTNFGTPICDASCVSPGGMEAPRTGSYFAWFGGISSVVERSEVSQTVTISDTAASAILTFYLWETVSGGPAVDVLTVSVDSDVVFTAMEQSGMYSSDYTQVDVDLFAYADGNPHVLTFEAVTYGADVTNFLVDDVTLVVSDPTDVALTSFDGNASSPLVLLWLVLIPTALIVAGVAWRRRAQTTV